MHSLLTRFRKLASVSPREIGFRLKSSYVHKKERLQYALNIRPDCKEFSLLQNNKYRFFLDGADRMERVEQLESLGYARKIVQEAEQVLTGKVSLLGVDMQIPTGEDWVKDPKTGKKWPFLFYSQVRHHPKVKDLDIKFVWEINRHQYLIPLGKAFWITGEEKYARAVFAVILDWIQFNPYHTGVNWTSALENAVRLFSWIWALELCKESDGFQRHLPRIKQSIHEQGQYIENNLSTYASPYNHLIGEAAALYLTGALFPELPRAGIWKKTGWKILEKTLDNQFHDDGMTVEQAVFYHHFTLGFYITCMLLKRINRKPIPDRMLKKIEAAIEISCYLQMPDGSFPMKGDIDSARSIYTGLNHSWDFSLFHFIGACLFKRPDFINRQATIPQEVFWLMSDSDLAWMKHLDTPEPLSPTRIFKKSGYCILKDSWESDANYFCFDFGEIAHGLSERPIPSAAHGHLDALSFECCALGRPFLIDAGFYTYFGDLKWHQYFRHEAAHNTVAVHGHHQADYCGRLKWQNIKPAALVKWQENHAAALCSAKISFKNNVTVWRTVHYQKNSFWIIHDTISSRVTETVETFLNFHPDVTVDIDRQKMQLWALNGSACILIQFLGKGELIDRSKDNHSPAGWVCEGYGLKEKAAAMSMKWYSNKETPAMPFVIIPFLRNAPRPEIQWDAIAGSGMIRTDRDSFQFMIQNCTDIHVKKGPHEKKENS